MFEFIPVSENNIFALRATGKLTDEDYRRFLPELEKLIEDCGSISLMIELVDFQGWEMKAAWDDFRFGIEHDSDFIRIAIVGQKSWQQWMAGIGDAFTSCKVRFFYKNDIQDAWDWLRAGNTSIEAENETAIIPNVNKAVAAYKHLLVALDFTPHSYRVLARSIEIARLYDAKLSLIHCVENTFYPDLGADLSMFDPGMFAEWDQHRHARAKRLMEKLVKTLDYPALQYDVIWGDPGSTILSYAEAQQVDMIVVGSHGRHGVARLLGTTAGSLMHNARCDVFVVRLPE